MMNTFTKTVVLASVSYTASATMLQQAHHRKKVSNYQDVHNGVAKKFYDDKFKEHCMRADAIKHEPKEIGRHVKVADTPLYTKAKNLCEKKISRSKNAEKKNQNRFKKVFAGLMDLIGRAYNRHTKDRTSREYIRKYEEFIPMTDDCVAKRKANQEERVATCVAGGKSKKDCEEQECPAFLGVFCPYEPSLEKKTYTKGIGKEIWGKLDIACRDLKHVALKELDNPGQFINF